jgi:formylglycine-generating enzyme required for sulfatase activity
VKLKTKLTLASIVIAILALAGMFTVPKVRQLVGSESDTSKTQLPTDTPMPPTPTNALVPQTPTNTPTIGSLMTRATDDMVMFYVPGGTFLMGSDEDAVDYAVQLCFSIYRHTDGTCERWVKDEQPAHTVTLDGFWIDRTEVTNAQYTLCVADGDCRALVYADDTTYNGDNYPVVGVSWQDAVDYCAWAGARLPTEAEWEYAARGSQGYIYPWGNEFDCSHGNFDEKTQLDPDVVPGGKGCDGYERTAPVGRFETGASWCGAMDMAGNVWEWVNDWFQSDYYGTSPSSNPLGPEAGDFKVTRGGGWNHLSYYARSAYRGRSRLDIREDVIGFRCIVATISSP